MRDLSKSQANACEHATSKRCRCRCNGAFHGAGRVTEDELSLLAPDDPHRPASVPDPVQLAIPAGVVVPGDPEAAATLEAARAGVQDWLDRGLLVLVDGRDGLAQLP